MTDTHKLVPVEPTNEMMRVGIKAARRAHGSCVPYQLEAGYKAILSAAPTQEASGVMHWTLVGTALPEPDKPVLVMGKAGDSRYMTTAMRVWVDDGDWSDYVWVQLCEGFNPNLMDAAAYDYDDEYEYTHWMPLPEPPILSTGGE